MADATRLPCATYWLVDEDEDDDGCVLLLVVEPSLVVSPVDVPLLGVVLVEPEDVPDDVSPELPLDVPLDVPPEVP
jgi:hypothetical protein